MFEKNSSLILLIRQESFCASHRLYNPNHDEAWNEKTYGMCSRANGHGHNYVLEVTVEGKINPDTGMVMNVKELKKIIHERIIDKVDHFHLNYDVPFLQNINPTTENVALAFWKELENGLPQGILYRLRLSETSKNIVEITRPL